MTISPVQNQSLWRKLWAPFFSFPVYGKYAIILASFLISFALMTYRQMSFNHQLQDRLRALHSGLTSGTLNDLIQLIDDFNQNSLLLLLVLAIFLIITSLLCINHLVNTLNQMNDGLESLRKSGGAESDCYTFTPVTTVSQDEIGQIADTVNGLIQDIHHISRFRRTIEADENTAQVYKRLADIFRELLNLPTFVIWKIDEQNQHIVPVHVNPSDLETEVCPLGSPDECRAKRTGEIVSSNGYPGICPVFPLSDVMTHTCVPMMVGGRILGVAQFLFLFVNSVQREENLSHSLQLAKQYLREALPILHSKQLAESLQEIATKDTLTGLYNRRFLERHIATILSGITRRKSEMGVLMCDLDYFKQVNDEYGHETGDLVLQGLSHILQNNIRDADLVIRYGGEEFLILLIDCQPDEAVSVAEKIRMAVEKQKFHFEGTSLRKTISVGVSSFPHDTKGFWECIKFADVAMYLAKERGRNKVLRFKPEMWEKENY